MVRPFLQGIKRWNFWRVHHQKFTERVFEHNPKDLRRASGTLETNLVAEEPLLRATQVGGKGAR